MLKLSITGGPKDIILEDENLTSVEYKLGTANESLTSRATDATTTLTVKGLIVTPTGDAPADDTVEIALWSLVKSKDGDIYRNVTVDSVSSGKVLRRFELPYAYIVSYDETYGLNGDDGSFTLVVAEKKDRHEDTEISGGFDA